MPRAHRCHENCRPAGESRPSEDPERREDHEPGDEDERRTRSRVVSAREVDVEARKRYGRLRSARARIRGIFPAAIEAAVGAMSASETRPSMRVDPDVSSPS